MSTIVEATVPAEGFALAGTLSSLPDAEFRMVRLVAHGGDREMPFLWARANDREGLYDALERDPSTRSFDVLGEFDEECLLRIDWQARTRVFVHVIGEEDATILDARGQGGTWNMQVFFPEHDSVSATYDVCQEYGIDISFDRICDLADTHHRGNLGLTEQQYEAISHAYEAGYYDVPRRVNQEELAEAFDVSHQALSERLRRGHATVIANALYRKLDRPEGSGAARFERSENLGVSER